MPLQLLTDTQVSEYVSSLDLAPSSTAYRTVNALLMLPAGAFARAISATAQGIVTFADFRTLPAMNERLVDELIAARLGATDITAIAWRYREVWLPASIDITAMRAAAIGDASAAVAAKYTDRWGGVIRPPYDTTGTDENKYHSFNDAYVAYLILAANQIPASFVQTFRNAHGQFRAAYPDMLQPTDAQCPVLALVESCLTSAIFLERATGGRAANPILDWVMSKAWRNVTTASYDTFMADLAYPAMAESNDPGRTGLPGTMALASLIQWTPLANTGNYSWDLDSARMAKIFLPSAYGSSAIDIADLTALQTKNAAIVSYFEAAVLAISSIHEYINRNMQTSAAVYRASPGQSIGMLLCLTNS